ncbi:hypothetical protein GCM10007422_14010 [Pedobacter zeae]|uniref:Uncharacterized protein n=2 Tax=Pedobacter zeae TaxID=1737356 RepID=A0A7W6K6U3_9SPHI|nr:hypothetical protein [Pedobacter zeae]GGH00626.1 hypothetical protein GCM10007422_14010 [Pedobacter zeae]
MATDNYLKGRPTSALNSELTSKPTSLSVIETEYNGKFVHGLSIEKIKGMVSSNGETGIVFGNRGPGKVGHVFNVINQMEKSILLTDRLEKVLLYQVKVIKIFHLFQLITNNNEKSRFSQRRVRGIFK